MKLCMILLCICTYVSFGKHNVDTVRDTIFFLIYFLKVGIHIVRAIKKLIMIISIV